MIVDFHNFDDIDGDLLKYAVIVTRYRSRWVYVRHKKRETWEIPGGHKELHEEILDAAKRELYEETGADKFSINPICVYSVSHEGQQTFGGLFFANIFSFTTLPDLEIKEVSFKSELPDELTYPEIQPCLQKKIEKHLQNISVTYRDFTIFCN